MNINGIKANEKPTSDNMSYVYAENDKKEFVRIQKDVLKMILGIPTRLSELNNDKGFVDKMVNDLKNYYLKSETYTRDEIDNKLSLVPRFSVKVVSTLPTENISETTVYLVPAGEDENNLYTEYINVDGLWEILGAQKIAKFEVTKEDIEFALGYVPADNEKVLQIENDVKSKLSEAELSSAIEEALRQAKESGEFDGANGITPHIGNNGNWYLGEEDTNVKAQGIDGRGIKSLEKTSSTGNIDTYTITYTDGTKFMYNVVNASNESGGIVAETDPTVPSWAKQPTKPSYTAQEVGALPNTTKIPVNTSDLNNDNEFITKTVTDLVNYYTKSQSYSKDEIDNKLSAIPKFSIQPVEQLPTANISETTVYLLKTGDEENNLYTEYIYVDNKWEYLGKQTIDLSGYALKTEIPTRLSSLTNDAGFITNTVSNLVNYYSKSETYSKDEIDAKGYLTEHQDLSDYAKRSEVPKNLAQLNQDSTHRVVTDSQVETWNNKSNFSGNYNDLTNKPTIPSKTSQLANDSNFAKKEDIPTELPASDVYDWAKQPQKPTYSASEVGALPNTTEIPEKTSDLTNDSGFITKAVNDLANYYLKSQTYSAEEIDNKISTIPKFSIEVVTSLPTTNISNTTVYLIASGNEQDNLYTEYIYVNGKWEYLGKQTVDLSGYVKRTELSSYYTKTEIDSLLQTIRNSIEEVQKMPVVRYDSQELTGKQKEQARTNIGAADAGTMNGAFEEFGDTINAMGQGLDELSEQIADLEDTIVADVLLALGTPIVGTVDENNVVTLEGDLANGTYTFRYINKDEYVEIGTKTIGGATYENLLSSAKSHTDVSKVFNDVGYMNNVRPSSSSPYYSAMNGYVVTGCFECDFDSTFYIKGITLVSGDDNCRLSWGRVMNNAFGSYYCKNGEIAGEGNYCNFETLGEQYYKITFNKTYLEANCPLLEYFFIGGVGTGENLIVSKTPIE